MLLWINQKIRNRRITQEGDPPDLRLLEKSPVILEKGTFLHVPGHLLASMLRNSVAQMQGDDAASLAAQRAFLEHYDEQITSGRQEYIDHQRSIEPFKSQAEARVGDGG